MYVENSDQTIADFKSILNLVKLVGVDVCEEVIEYARNNYGPDSKIDFRQLDITTKAIPQNLQNEFDLVTSFYCLQVIADFKKALQNMCAMVKPGGDLFIYFMGKCFALDIWSYLGETARWKPYMKNYKKMMCPIHFSKNRVQLVEEALKNNGYIVHFCTEQSYQKVYNKESITEFFKSMSYFDIPKDMEYDCMLDHHDYFRRCNLNFYGENREENFIYNYTLIIVYATKQL
ncbi:hypothetical protein FQR65_LT13057 [Abscondita terminalis]|nr:hypothetical protein FQR65_LT13057 [Abscondita terminalis]